jgi:hypothetical protein
MSFNKNPGLEMLLIIYLLLPLSGIAQNDTIVPFSQGTHHLYFYSSLDINANTLTNEFIGDFYKGDILTRDLRNKQSGKLNDGNNIGGYNLEGGLYYFFAPKDFKNKFGYYLGVEEHEFAEINFRKNFFDLIFFGNEPYTDQFVKFDNMKLNVMAWQQIKVGIFKAWHHNGKVNQLGGAFAINLGQKNMCIDVHKGSFFTQKDGEFVALDVDMDIRRTDTSRSGFGSSNGDGVSFDLSYNYTDLKSNEFQIRVSDIGYIRWDRNPDNFNRDTTFRFDGFDVDIFDLSSPIFNANTGDSILNEIIGSDRLKSYLTWLPLDIHLTYTHYFGGRHFSVMGDLRYKLFSIYRPCITLKPGYKWFLKKSSIGIYPILTYGGYGKFNAGLNLAAQISQKFYIELGTSTINSYIFPGKSAGLSGMLTFYSLL